MAADAEIRQVLLEQIAHLPEEQLQDVLLFVNSLLNPRQQTTLAQQSEIASGTNTADVVQDPLSEFIGAVSHGSIAQNIDEAVYGR